MAARDVINEQQRLIALQSYQILDTASEPEYDDIAQIAAQICGTPIALVSLVDASRQWFKAAIGLDARQTPRGIAFCAHAIEQTETFIVEDASQDPRFTNNPLVTDDPNLRFYAGVPLVTPDGHPLGTLCVLDRTAKKLTPRQEISLRALARQVVRLLELRRFILQQRIERQQHEHQMAETHVNLQYRVEERTAERDAARLNESQVRTDAERVNIALAAGTIVGIWDWDLVNDQFTVDEAFARSVGLDSERCRAGIPLPEIFELAHPDDQAGLSQAVSAALQHGGRYAHEYRIRRYDGTYRWIEANGHVELGADDAARRFSGVLLDVEERRALRTERDRANAELRAINETLEQRINERAEEFKSVEEALRQSQKMEAVGQLTGGLAHDFNNLLAGISGSLELVQLRLSQGRLKDIEKYVVAAQGAAKRASALTHRLLAFSRRQTLSPKATDVDQLIMGMLDLIQRTAGPSIQVRNSCAPGLWRALVDPSQLENALLNLCINSRDAMPRGGKITIETGNCTIDCGAAKQLELPEGQYLSLRVSDTGVGMSPAVIAKAFDPFFTTKPTGEGTGLGLSMIYGFAKQSGGQARIDSEVNRGTTVCLYLPRHRGRAELEVEALKPIAAPAAALGETILIVDDEPTVRMLISDVLTDLGYTVIEAADGAGGLRVLQSDIRIDLLITDVGLPGGINGRQMADAARVNRPDLKVLFITGFAENALLTEGQLEQGMAVLTKPFAVETLTARTRELIVA